MQLHPAINADMSKHELGNFFWELVLPISILMLVFGMLVLAAMDGEQKRAESKFGCERRAVSTCAADCPTF